MSKEPRFIGKEEQAYIDSKILKKDPVFKKCEGCLQMFFEEQLARFGRHTGSPWFCKNCATNEFERLKKKLGEILDPADKKIIIE